jgi:5-methyltetrahydrofolate--homocysteine methyltransferase
VSDLLDRDRKKVLTEKNHTAQERLRQLHAGGGKAALYSLEEAQSRKLPVDFGDAELSTPEFLGARTLDDFDLNEVAQYIDWTYFFSAWELKGRFPGILEHEKYGEAARELFDNGKELLQRIIDNKQLTARARYGFWPANSDGDDLVLYTDESRTTEKVRFHLLRQQRKRQGTDTCLCLTDFVAPKDSGKKDYVGAFALTAGVGADELARSYEKRHDDYNAIMVKALADRLAEAFAELLHARARKEWGYGKSEGLTNEELIAEKYRGIRPAFGYPACPEHTEKGTLFQLLEAENVGIALTESYAMMPAASVSGLYLGHPKSKYFNLGLIGRDQVEDYARRKRMSVTDVERWLMPSLGYEAS